MAAGLGAVLPAAARATTDPGEVAALVQGLVKESLGEAWRELHRATDSLEALGALLELLLGSLPEPNGDGVDCEEACAACLKLARNLCVGAPEVQEHWWARGGVVERLMERLRADVALADERGAAWSEASLGFLVNSIAGHADLRSRAWTVWFPADLAAACSISWRRPELAFQLLQTLAASGGGPDVERSCDLSDAPWPVRALVLEPDGQHLLFVLASLLFRGGVGIGEQREALAPKAWEWASIFFHNIWRAGGFVPAYQAIQGIDVASLHAFWCRVVGLPPGTPTAPPGVVERLVGRLCHRAEVLALFWHSIHGLDSTALVHQLLADAAFVELASEALVRSMDALSQKWDLDWAPPSEIPAEASAALGLGPAALNVAALAAPRAAEGDGEEGCIFRELLQALLAVSAVPRGRRRRSRALDGAGGSGSPGSAPHLNRFTAVCLLASTASLDALHRLRFGALATADAKPRAQPPKESLEAARACMLVEQLRLCANFLYDDEPAQDFIRLVGGLRVLLSHCYADPEMPLLREAGVFAVRNATNQNLENQAAVRELLASRQTASGGSAAAGTVQSTSASADEELQSGQPLPTVQELGLSGANGDGFEST